MAEQDVVCRGCGQVMPADAPQALCPACLLQAGLIGDGTATSSPEPFTPALPPPRIDGYHLIEQVGVGGMGVVYKAEQREPIKRIVAVKLIKLGMDTTEVISRFESERQALALLNHPHVAAVYDAGATDTGRPYFVMEYVAGEPITEFCDRHNYTIKQRLELFIQACDAIGHAHQKAIIHRDIKPSNILVMLESDKPVAKVIDFGVAKATAQRLTERTRFTAHGQIIGTPEYMSPEQAEMNAIDIDTRTDVYSLGVVLYELLAGALPFDPKTLRHAAYEKIQQIIREADPPRPSVRLSGLGDEGIGIATHRQTQLATLERELRSELEWIPLKALRKDRSQRYRTVLELAQDIHNYVGRKPLIAGPESSRYRLKKFLRRNRGPVAAVTAVILATGVGLTLATIGFVTARREAARADRQTVTATNVAEYLQQMLATANPNAARGGDYTVRQMLDDFANSLGSQMANQPVAEAELRSTIGMAYRRLGDREKAESHLAKALKLRRGVFGAQHEKYADSLVNYAWVLKEHDRRDDAEGALREALAIYRTRGAVPQRVVPAMWVLQSILAGQRKFTESEAIGQEALTIARQSPNVAIPEIASVYHSLSVLKLRRSAFVEAETLARTSVELHLRLHGPEHPETGYGLNYLGSALERQQKFAEALAAYQRALAIFRKAFPADHWAIASALFNIGELLQDAADASALIELFPSTDKLNEVELTLRGSLATKRNPQNTRGDPATTAARCLAEMVGIDVKLSREFAAAGRPDEADAAGQKGIALLRELQAGHIDNPELAAATYLGLLRPLIDLGRREEAKECRKKLLKLRLADPFVLDDAAWTLATCVDPAHSDPVLAVELAKRAVAITPSDGACWTTLGVARYRAGEFPQAIADLEKSVRLRNGGESSDFYFLAMAHHRIGDANAARRSFDQGVRWTEQHDPRDAQLLRFRAEAEQVLGLTDVPSTAPASRGQYK